MPDRAEHTRRRLLLRQPPFLHLCALVAQPLPLWHLGDPVTRLVHCHVAVVAEHDNVALLRVSAVANVAKLADLLLGRALGLWADHRDDWRGLLSNARSGGGLGPALDRRARRPRRGGLSVAQQGHLPRRRPLQLLLHPLLVLPLSAVPLPHSGHHEGRVLPRPPQEVLDRQQVSPVDPPEVVVRDSPEHGPLVVLLRPRELWKAVQGVLQEVSWDAGGGGRGGEAVWGLAPELLQVERRVPGVAAALLLRFFALELLGLLRGQAVQECDGRGEEGLPTLRRRRELPVQHDLPRPRIHHCGLRAGRRARLLLDALLPFVVLTWDHCPRLEILEGLVEPRVILAHAALEGGPGRGLLVRPAAAHRDQSSAIETPLVRGRFRHPSAWEQRTSSIERRSNVQLGA
mmetsp:Transcript_3616/g.10909  ORF Transcript_3616/g.10909 Transcript_3616/m.10909 type:complete len:402 (-) Transcript_3616:141-1346(-)